MLFPSASRLRPAAALLAAVVALAPLAAGADGFSCGTRVVTTGMPAAQVLAACGDPAEVRRDTILRRPVIWRQGRPWPAGNEPVEVPVERWLYNFGPSRLMRRLRFEDGILADIDTLGYGFDP